MNWLKAFLATSLLMLAVLPLTFSITGVLSDFDCKQAPPPAPGHFYLDFPKQYYGGRVAYELLSIPCSALGAIFVCKALTRRFRNPLAVAVGGANPLIFLAAAILWQDTLRRAFFTRFAPVISLAWPGIVIAVIFATLITSRSLRSSTFVKD